MGISPNVDLQPTEYSLAAVKSFLFCPVFILVRRFATYCTIAHLSSPGLAYLGGVPSLSELQTRGDRQSPGSCTLTTCSRSTLLEITGVIHLVIRAFHICLVFVVYSTGLPTLIATLRSLRYTSDNRCSIGRSTLQPTDLFGCTFLPRKLPLSYGVYSERIILHDVLTKTGLTCLRNTADYVVGCVS